MARNVGAAIVVRVLLRAPAPFRKLPSSENGVCMPECIYGVVLARCMGGANDRHHRGVDDGGVGGEGAGGTPSRR